MNDEQTSSAISGRVASRSVVEIDPASEVVPNPATRAGVPAGNGLLPARL
jgi:hypothetical protein